MERKFTFSSAAVQFAVACDLIVLHCMLTPQDGISWWFFPGVFLLYGPLIYLCNRLFLIKEKTLRSLAVFNGSAMVLMSALCLAIDGWTGIGTMVFILIFSIWLTVEGAVFAVGRPEVKHMLICLDVTVLVLAVFSIYSAFYGLEAAPGLIMTAGFTVVCMGTAVRRCGSNMRLRGWIFMLISFIAVFSVMMLILGSGAAAAGQGIMGLFGGVAVAVEAMDDALLKLFQPLAELFPRIVHEEIVIQGAGVSENISDSAFAEGSMIGMGSLLLIIAIFLVIGAGIALIRAGKIKLSPAKLGVNNGAAGKDTGRKVSAKSFICKLRERISVYVYIRRYKDTPKGIYLYLTNALNRRGHGKKTGETPREFLTRMAEAAGASPELKRALLMLTADVEEIFYSPRVGSEKAEYAKVIRKEINKVYLQQ